MDYEREVRELVRENLQTIAVDVFQLGDPIIMMSPKERQQYLGYFHILVKEKKIIQRLQFLINTQANITLKNSRHGTLDMTGCMTMNGISTVKDEIERLSAMYEKEKSEGLPRDPREALRL